MTNLIVTDKNQYELLSFALERCGFEGKWPDETTSIAVRYGSEEGPILAVILFNAFYGHACHIHIASDHTRRWATPRTLRAIFSVPFRIYGVQRLEAEMSEDNTKAIINALKVGFKFEGVKRTGMDDGSNAIIMGMLAQECRWIKPKMDTSNGQE